MSSRKEFVDADGKPATMPTIEYVRLLAWTICQTIDDPQEGNAENRISDALRIAKEICAVIRTEKQCHECEGRGDIDIERGGSSIKCSRCNGSGLLT